MISQIHNILAILLLTLSFLPIAQAQKKVNPIASEKRGDLYSTIQEFGKAEIEYMDVLSSGSIDMLSYDRVNIKLANALYNIRSYSEADKRFETVFVRNKKAFTPEFATAYVSTLIRLGKFQRAIEVSTNFSEQPLFKCHKPLQNLRDGLKYQAKLPVTVSYTVRTAPFNAPGSNYAVTDFGCGLLFVHHSSDEKALVKGAQFYSSCNGRTSEPYTNIPHTLQAGPSTYDKTNGTMIYTDNRYLGSGIVRELKDQNLVTNLLRLVELKYNKSINQWEDPKDIFSDKMMFSTCHPSISEDGRRMYFSANLADSEGSSMDIYMSTRTGKSWSNPVCLGKYINTKYEELYPYIYGDRLYFVSNGHDGLGGMDVFYVKVDAGGMPINGSLTHLPYPVNTIYNDYAFMHTANGSGYFSSDRPEGKNLDTIYKWEEKEDILQENSLIEKASTVKANQ